MKKRRKSTKMQLVSNVQNILDNQVIRYNVYLRNVGKDKCLQRMGNVLIVQTIQGNLKMVNNVFQTLVLEHRRYWKMVHAKIVHPSSLVSEVMGKYAYLITIAMIGKRHWKTIYVSTVLIIQELKMITKSVPAINVQSFKY